MAEPARILVVDDEQDMVTTLRDILEASGYHVEVASSGREALERCREQPPTCALIDIFMPALNGVEAGREIKRLAPQVAILLMTANIASEPARRVLGERTWEVLAKPLDLEYLLRWIEKQCRPDERGGGDPVLRREG